MYPMDFLNDLSVGYLPDTPAFWSPVAGCGSLLRSCRYGPS
jgi:hypothetical protein